MTVKNTKEMMITKNEELDLENIESFLPPTIVEVNNGKWAIVGGRWYPIPTTTTLEMLRAAWKGKRVNQTKPTADRWIVEGSKGDTYEVEYKGGQWKCSCQGFGWRRSCKHVDSIKKQYK